MNLRTPLARAIGVGSAKSGAGHWWSQRLSALLLAVTVPWFIYLLVSLSGVDYQTLRLTIAHPFNSLMLTLLVIGVFSHAQLGLQVIVEDYVHQPALEIALQILIKFACLAAGLAALIAIGRIAFTA